MKRPHSPLWKLALLNLVRGFLMGGADIIPGVSGGTIALILGIYERLVGAISNIDLEFLQLIRQRRFRAAANHIDLAFLITLALGIGSGLLLLAGLMHYLLTDAVARPRTLAAFFGLILASGILVMKLVRTWNPLKAVLALTAAATAFWIAEQTGHSVEPSLVYLFFCGMIAICAMILPGISGAFILVLLGTYEYVTNILKGIPKGDIDSEKLLVLSVFCLGCLIGLVTFSKFLKYMLARHESMTMAVLCGFIFGSLKKVWPFKVDLTPELEFKEKLYKDYLPTSIDAEVILCVAIAIAAVVAVFALEWIAHQYHLLDSGDPFEETPDEHPEVRSN